MFKKIIRGTAIFGASLSLSLLLLATLLVIAGGAWAMTLDTKLDEELFFGNAKSSTTRLYYKDEAGEVQELSSDRISGYENALYCPIGEMPRYLPAAFVAIEDKRFYEHGGIDWARTASAMLDYAKGEGAHFGGSGITQQLVKNLTGDSERSIRRKLTELMRAARLEKILSKDEILESYLNVVNLSQGCYGVRTAANAYFSKEVRDLTLDEAATIAAITNNPTRYDPVRHPEENRKRRDIILKAMYDQGMIGGTEYRAAIAKKTELNCSRQMLSGRINSWFADLAVEEVIAALVLERGMSEAAASRMVYCGGLKIYLTVDPRLQEAVDAYFADPERFLTHQNGKKAQCAMMIVDPKTGDILAVAGAVGKKQANRVQSFASNTKRPSGSVIKPLSVYAPALERGLITWGSVFDDVPLQFRQNGAPWPRNAPNIYRGLTNINAAVTHSVNTVSVSVLERLGTGNSYRFLRDRLGFTSLDPVKDTGTASLALGQQSQGVTLREIVGGYTALANGGIYTGTRCFYRVEDRNGEVLLEMPQRAERAMDETNAAIMTMLLREVTKEGTAKALTLTERVAVAGKTGTSGNNCDKWFVGYTPELLAGVWYGHEYPEPLSDVKGNPALNVFDEVMAHAITLRGITQRYFKSTDDIVAVRYCRDSGKLMSDACSYDPRGDRSEVGYFKRGTEPTQYCDCHVCIRYCDHGGVACEYCPEEECHTTALLRVFRRFPRQIKVLDAPYTYGGDLVKTEPNLTNNEPYYAINYNSKENFGVGMDVIPYNRVCPDHRATDDFWQRRYLVS